MGGDEEATRVDDPSRSRAEPAAPRPITRGGATPTLGTHSALGAKPLSFPKPEAVLRRAAYEQTRRTAVSGLLFNTAGLVVAPLVGGDPLAVRVFVVAMVLADLNNAWLLVTCRDERRYRQRHALAYFAVAAFVNGGVLFYLGTFGPILGMLVLNVYTACLAYTRRVARIVLAGSVMPFALLGSAMAAGLLRDPGLVTITSQVGPAGQIAIVIAFVVFLVLTYAQARETRDLMVGSLVERDAAVRVASHREALLIEARNDLEQALHAGGLGRFSDQTLGSYRLGAVLGRGGMGEVYEAVHVETGAPAAVKMLLPEVLGRPEYVHRFLREVKIAASLQSEHVVKVLEIGDQSAPMPYLAMERLEGEDLAQMLRRAPRMNQAALVRLLHQVGRGVQAAAAAGIVHRDLKPQNLFLSDGPPATWKILDFGVSTHGGDAGHLTRGEAIGTPRYMAPEQARGDAVDTRADVYSLGAIAYRGLTGRPPFEGEQHGPVLLQVISRMPARPGALAKLPADVDLVLAVALAKKAADRFGDAVELADAVEAALEERLDPALRARGRALVAANPWQDA